MGMATSSNQPDENTTVGTSKPEGQKYGLSWFDDFQMVDDESVIDQAYKIFRMIADQDKCCPQLHYVLNDKEELVNVIIEKLPESWEDYAAKLKDKQMEEELSFGALVNHLRVEEKKRAQYQKVEVSIPEKVSTSKSQSQNKGKKVITTEDQSVQKKRTRSSQAMDTFQDPPLMADAMKSHNSSDRRVEIAKATTADDSETIGSYRRRTRRKLQPQAHSDDENGQDKGSTTDLPNAAAPVDPVRSSFKPQIQASLKDIDFEKFVETSMSKTLEVTTVLDASTFESVEVFEKEPVKINTPLIYEPIVDSIKDTPMQGGVLQDSAETFFDHNTGLKVHDQSANHSVFTSQTGKEGEKPIPPMGHEAVNMGNADVENTELEFAEEVDTQSPVAFNIVFEPEVSLTTKVVESQKQTQGTEVLQLINQGVSIDKASMTSPSTVNKERNPDLVNPVLGNTPTSDLDLMLNKARTYFESYSRSVFEFSKSLTPPAFYHLSEETKDEVRSFFRLLELPLAEVATEHIPAFTSCVNHLITRKVLPDSEHIGLEEFWSSLSKNLTVAAYCQKKMKEKLDIMNQFANTFGTLDELGNKISQLKDKLYQLDAEEAALIARLDKIREERLSLLAQKELINHELADITHDEQGIEAIASMARDDYLKNKARYNVIDNQWNYFVTFFMEFKSKIQ